MTEYDRDHEIAEQLAQLPREGDPANDLWRGIAARVRAPTLRRGWSIFLRLAAASVLFAVGLGTGLAVGAPPSPPETTVSAAMQLAADVQRTGTDYVAALAAFASVVDSLSADVRLQGREAAIAALLGAATEWATLNGEIPEDMELFRSISDERDELTTVRF